MDGDLSSIFPRDYIIITLLSRRTCLLVFIVLQNKLKEWILEYCYMSLYRCLTVFKYELGSYMV